MATILYSIRRPETGTQKQPLEEDLGLENPVFSAAHSAFF
jgi:hypothetical protein